MPQNLGMKLLFVATGAGGGGTETHFETLARTLADAGDEVTAVVRPGSIMETRLAGSAVRIAHGRFRNSGDPRGILAVAAAIRRVRPDWIVGSLSTEYWPLLALGGLFGVPVALFKHMDFPMKPLTRRFVPRLARPFIVVSEAMHRSFIARGIPAELLRVLPNPIEVEEYGAARTLRAQARQALGFTDDDVVIGYLGRMSPEKGIYVLADALERAMPRSPALRALWVGGGPDETALRARLAASPHAARHLLRPFEEDVIPVYAALDVVALPSLIAESFGRVAAEAEASGLPVLASRIGGIPEAVEEGVTAELLPPGAADAWAEALVALAADPARRRRMGEAGPGVVRTRFSARAVADQFRALLADERARR